MIMMCLLQGELYGLEILDKIKDASGGIYVLKQPTLYSALKRLEDKCLICGRYVDMPNAPRRRYFKLTEQGKNSFVNKKEAWKTSKELLDYFFSIKMGLELDQRQDNSNANIIAELEKLRAELESANERRIQEPSSLDISFFDGIQSSVPPQTQSAEIIEMSTSDMQLEQLRQLREVGVVPISEENYTLDTDQELKLLEDELEECKLKIRKGIDEVNEQLAVTTTTPEVSPQYITQYFITGDYVLGNGTTNIVAKNDTDGAFSLPLSCTTCDTPTSHSYQAIQEPQPLCTSPFVHEEIELGTCASETTQEIRPYILNKDDYIKEQENLSNEAGQQIFTQSAHDEISYLRDQVQSLKSDFHYHQSVHSSRDSDMKRYIGPNEYAVWQKPEQDNKKLHTHVAINDNSHTMATVYNENSSEIELRPFTKHFSRQKCGDFILYNRLKAAVSAIVAAVLIFAIVIAWDVMRTTYQQNEEIMFVLAYVAISIYVLVNLAIWAVYPRMRRLNGCYKNELIVRSCVTASILAIVLGINIIMGLSNVNTAEHVVFFIVPSILALGVVLEWVGIHFLKKVNFFRG